MTVLGFLPPNLIAKIHLCYNQHNMRPITKAVIAAAGYGTRFLPATKNQPKQMLPIVDKPIIHYCVEEAVASGITDIIIVTQAGHFSLEDYFDSHAELEHVLEESGKDHYLKMIREIPQMANFVFVRQTKNLPYGNATPLLVTQRLIDDDEAFVYMFGDDLVRSKVPATKQLIDVFQREKPTAVMGVQEVPWEETYRYGIVEYVKNTKNNRVVQVLEKPTKEKAPSNMAVFGRYVFSYDVIRETQKTSLGKGGELWAADVLNRLAQKRAVIAQPIEGEWLTTGDPLNYLKTTVKFALDRKDLGEDFKKFLQETVKL